MAPKTQRVVVERAPRGAGRQQKPQGYLGQTYAAITSPENASVVRSIAVFGAAVAFFHSSWSEFLLPPM